jgi:hypothetical protein
LPAVGQDRERTNCGHGLHSKKAANGDVAPTNPTFSISSRTVLVNHCITVPSLFTYAATSTALPQGCPRGQMLPAGDLAWLLRRRRSLRAARRGRRGDAGCYQESFVEWAPTVRIYLRLAGYDDGRAFRPLGIPRDRRGQFPLLPY